MTPNCVLRSCTDGGAICYIPVAADEHTTIITSSTDQTVRWIADCLAVKPALSHSSPQEADLVGR